MLNPTYLHLSRCNVFHFRFPIPPHPTPNGKAAHIKVSLQTRNPKEALRLANMLSYHASIILRSCELANMDYGDIREILKTHFKELIEQRKEEIYRDGPLPDHEVQRLRREIEATQQAIAEGRNDIIEGEDINDRLQPIIDAQGLDMPEGSDDYNMLASEYKHAYAMILVVTVNSKVGQITNKRKIC